MQTPSVLKLNAAQNIFVDDLYDREVLYRLPFCVYPDPASTTLRDRLAEYTGFAPSFIACGNGADELIDLVFSLFTSPGRSILICPPTFHMHYHFARLRHISCQEVVRSVDTYAFPLAAVLTSSLDAVDLIVIDSPNNPTGDIISRENLIQVLSLGKLVLLDEAYYESAGVTHANLIRTYSNLIVIRSFSKWAGLAGLRLGYMIAQPDVIKKVIDAKPPYNVNSLAQHLGLVALDNRKHILNRMGKLRVARKYLHDRLAELGIFDLFGHNLFFILIKPHYGSIGEWQKLLKNAGILVQVTDQPLINDALRISIPTQQDSEILVQRIKEIYRQISVK